MKTNVFLVIIAAALLLNVTLPPTPAVLRIL